MSTGRCGRLPPRPAGPSAPSPTEASRARRRAAATPTPAGCRSGPASRLARRRPRHPAPLGRRGPRRGVDARPAAIAASTGAVARAAGRDRRRGVGRPARQHGREPGAPEPRLSPALRGRCRRRDRVGDRRRRRRSSARRYRQDGRRLVAALIAYLDADAADARRARSTRGATPTAIVDDQAAPAGRRRARSLTEAVALFVAARRPFLAELTGLGRRRSLDRGPAGRAVRRRVRRCSTGCSCASSPPTRPGRRHDATRRVVLPALTSDPRPRLQRSPCSTSGASGAAASSSSGRSGCSSTASRPAARRSPRRSGWNEALYRTWYLTGAVWTAGWLGLGTAFLLGRTRFGYSFALCLFLAGLFTFLVRNKPEYAGRRHAAAAVLHRRGHPRPGRRGRDLLRRTSAGRCSPPRAVVGATVLSVVLMATTTLAAPGLRGRPGDGACRSRRCSRRQLRLLTPFMNITGAFALILGAIFSTYVFMPKTPRPAVLARPEPARRRVPVQPAHRPGRDRRQPRRVAAGRRPRPCSRASSTAASRRRSSSPSARSSRPSPTRSTGSA